MVQTPKCKDGKGEITKMNEVTIREAVLEYIEKNPNCSTDDIISAYGFDTWRILEVLDELKKEGKIK